MPSCISQGITMKPLCAISQALLILFKLNGCIKILWYLSLPCITWITVHQMQQAFAKRVTTGCYFVDRFSIQLRKWSTSLAKWVTSSSMRTTTSKPASFVRMTSSQPELVALTTLSDSAAPTKKENQMEPKNVQRLFLIFKNTLLP